MRTVDGLENRFWRLRPDKRFGGVLVANRDVAPKLAPQIADAGEHAAVERATLQLRKPALDGVEPGCAGWREVQVESRVVRQVVEDILGLVRAAIVEDQMQIDSVGSRSVYVLEKGQEILGCVPLGHPPEYLATRDIERCVEARGAVAFVVVRPAFNLPRAQWQQRLGTVERLNLRLLVYRKDHRTPWRAQVQTHHVEDLFRELWILADLEGLDPMRPQVGDLPGLLHLPARYSCVLRHQAHAPVGRFLGDSLRGQAQDLPGLGGVELSRLARTRSLRQAAESTLHIALSPLVDRATRHIELLTDRLRAVTLSAQQNDSRAL